MSVWNIVVHTVHVCVSVSHIFTAYIITVVNLNPSVLYFFWTTLSLSQS